MCGCGLRLCALLLCYPHTLEQLCYRLLLGLLALFWAFRLGFALRVRRQSIHESYDNAFDVHVRVQSCDRGKELIEGMQVKLVGEDLGDNCYLLAKLEAHKGLPHAFQKILLRQNISALYNLLK